MQKTSNYLNELTQTVEQIINTVEAITQSHPKAQLAQRPAPDRWSVLDNLEHLNLYGDFYLPTFEQTIERGRQQGLQPRENYKAGWLGSYFAKSMRPKGGNIANRMKTFKSKDPVLTEVPDNVVERFLEQQQKLLRLLQQAEQTDIQKLRMPTTLGSFPKIRLGDAFAFFIAHEERHMLQIQRAMDSLSLEVKPTMRWG